MAEIIKKFVDLEGLETLVGQIKAEDKKAIDAAKAYADSLADNYDQAGAATTAETNAKKYTDEQIEAKADKKGAADAVNTKLTAEVERAKAKEGEIVASVEGVKGVANANKTAIEAINNETTGILAKAKEDAKAKADAVQANVDTLSGKVGDIPEGSKATTVVGYVDEKVEKASTNVTTLAGRVEQAEKDIDAIEADYLKNADKTELEGKITTAQNKADAAKTHSEGVATDLTNEVKARTEADEAQVNRIKTLEDKIVDLNGAMHFKGVVESLPEDVTGYKSGDVIIIGEKEYVFNGTAFAEFGDVSAEGARIGTLETKMNTAQADITKAKEDIAANTKAIGTKADASALADETKARTKADSAMDTRIKTIEGKLGDGEGSVTNQIATAKQEAIDAAAKDAKAKADQALKDAKKYADDEDAKIEARVDALETDTHTHANKEELDKFEVGDKAKLDGAATKAHEHANKAVLDGITDVKVKAWDSAEKNAKDYADGLNKTMTTKVDGIDGRLTTVEGSVKNKAESSTVTALTERVTTAEANITKNTETINAFVAVTPAEIKAIFAKTTE